jgi:hypothetical protein
MSQHALDVGGKPLHTVDPADACSLNKHDEQDRQPRPVHVQEVDQVHPALRTTVRCARATISISDISNSVPGPQYLYLLLLCHTYICIEYHYVPGQEEKHLCRVLVPYVRANRTFVSASLLCQGRLIDDQSSIMPG